MQNIIMVKHMKSKKYDKAFLTGCDASQEWMLPWFFKNYKKHSKTPLIFANFGISDLEIVKPHVHAIIDLTKIKESGWFKKPKAMINSPSIKTVWLDTDCEIVHDIDGIFDLLTPNKLNMVEDKPWTKRRNEIWYNSGVVGFINKPVILYEWAKKVEQMPTVGDQEVLHSMLNPISQITYINPLPNEYNVMRLQLEHDDYKGSLNIIHWTGRKGKEKIRSMMNG
jgi:hypothetical protein